MRNWNIGIVGGGKTTDDIGRQSENSIQTFAYAFKYFAVVPTRPANYAFRSSNNQYWNGAGRDGRYLLHTPTRTDPVEVCWPLTRKKGRRFGEEAAPTSPLNY
jgi:hypothetical protein